jgi:hypothetical protein
MIAREMRLAYKSRVVARLAQSACKTVGSDGLVKVDAIVVYPTGQWQRTGQNGASCGHAHHIGRDAIFESRALPSQ